MFRGFPVRFVIAVVPIILGTLWYKNWHSNAKSEADLKGRLVSYERTIADANLRLSQRDKELGAALEQVKKVKAEMRTPGDIVKALPQYLPLPSPIRLDSADRDGLHLDKGAKMSRSPEVATKRVEDEAPSPVPAVSLPIEDIKPLFDFTQDCRSCKIQLQASEQDNASLRSEIAAVEGERNVAMAAKRGGSVLQKIKHYSMCFLAGAAAGILLSR